MVHCPVQAETAQFAQIIALMSNDLSHSTTTPQNGTTTSEVTTSYAEAAAAEVAAAEAAAAEAAEVAAAEVAAAAAAVAEVAPTSAPTCGSIGLAMAVNDAAESSTGDSRSGTFMCNVCHAMNTIGGNTDFYYAITVGLRVGVIHTW